MVRVVVDTNVLVSALISHGKPKTLVLKLLQEHTVVLTRPMLAELADVLTRDKFHTKSSQTKKYLLILSKKTILVKTSAHFKVISEDPDDDEVLNAAYKGKAEFIVTGDRHLLRLKFFRKIAIVEVSQMLEILKHPKEESSE